MILLGLLNSQVQEAPVAAEAFDLLESVFVTSSTSSVTFSGLNTYTEYKHLQMRLSTRSDTGSTNRLRLKVNNSSANLNRHALFGDGSSVSSISTGIFGDSIIVSDRLDGVNYSPTVLDILDFYNTAKNTTFRIVHGCTTAAPDPTRIELTSILYNNTATISSLTFGVGNTGFGTPFAAGSRFSLYGIKAGA